MVDHEGTRTVNVLRPDFSFISSVCTLPLHRNKSFLHENYVERGLSLRQIAALTMSSKTAIRKSLISYNVPIRTKGSCYSSPTFPKFGQKKVNGKLAIHHGEKKVLDLIIDMYEAGKTLNFIAKDLNKMKITTKGGGRRWC